MWHKLKVYLQALPMALRVASKATTLPQADRSVTPTRRPHTPEPPPIAPSIAADLDEQHGHAYYYDYRFLIAQETERKFVLTNGDGLGISEDENVNIQFMLVKDYLGFEQVEPGRYEKTVSKFNSTLRLACHTLVVYQNWILRVVGERAEAYQVLAYGQMPAGEGWQPVGAYYLNWLPKDSVMEQL